MADTNVLTLHFNGNRFNNHSVPLEFFVDINALNQVISLLAGDIYLQKHPDRQRLPKGFRDNYFLSVSTIKPGCTAVDITICNIFDQKTIGLSDEEKAIEEACSDVVQLLNSYSLNNMNEEDNTKLNRVRPYFDKFGRNLRADETIEFETYNKKALFNRKMRQDIINSNPEHTDEVELFGLVSELDKYNNTYTCKITIKENGKDNRLDLPVPEAFKTSINDAFYKCENGQKIFLKGEGVYKKGELKRLQNIEEIQILDVLDIQARLNELMDLQDGWYEGQGKSLNKERLNELSNLFDRYFQLNKLPHIYPTPDGNIEAEWSIGDNEIILEIELNTFKGTLILSDLAEDKSNTIDFDLSKDTDWSRLIEAISKVGV